MQREKRERKASQIENKQEKKKEKETFVYCV